jgi:hypothetical protein
MPGCGNVDDDAASRSVSDGAASEGGRSLLQVEAAQQGGLESVCGVGLSPVGAWRPEYPWVAASRPRPLSDGPTPRLPGERPGGPFGQPSKSGCSGRDSVPISRLVSEPCHSVASLKYSFWAPDGTALRPAEHSWGGRDQVSQTEADHSPRGSGLPVGGKQRGTMNLKKAIPRKAPGPGGSSANRSG